VRSEEHLVTYVHEKNGFVTAITKLGITKNFLLLQPKIFGFVTAITKLGITKNFLLLQPKFFPQQPNVLLVDPNILFL